MNEGEFLDCTALVEDLQQSFVLFGRPWLTDSGWLAVLKAVSTHVPAENNCRAPQHPYDVRLLDDVVARKGLASFRIAARGQGIKDIESRIVLYDFRSLFTLERFIATFQPSYPGKAIPEVTGKPIRFPAAISDLSRL